MLRFEKWLLIQIDTVDYKTGFPMFTDAEMLV